MKEKLIEIINDDEITQYYPEVIQSVVDFFEKLVKKHKDDSELGAEIRKLLK